MEELVYCPHPSIEPEEVLLTADGGVLHPVHVKNIRLAEFCKLSGLWGMRRTSRRQEKWAVTVRF